MEVFHKISYISNIRFHSFVFSLIFCLIVEKDLKNMEKFAGFLREAIAMNFLLCALDISPVQVNRGTVAYAFGVEDDLNAVTNELNMNIAQLSKTEDAERKRQLLEAVEAVEGISKGLGPILEHAKSNRKGAATQRKAQAAIERYSTLSTFPFYFLGWLMHCSLKDGVQAVAAAGSGGTGGMAERAVLLAQQMDVLENAVKSNNPVLANQALSSVSSQAFI
jgi:hypothetical protein